MIIMQHGSSFKFHFALIAKIKKSYVFDILSVFFMAQSLFKYSLFSNS